MKTKIPAIALLVMVIVDTVFTYIFWHRGMMIEENGFMLWALKNGAAYWAIKFFQFVAVIALMKFTVKVRFAQTAIIIILMFFIGIYARVVIQMF